MTVETYLDGVPVLAGEGVLCLLLEALLALRQSLVPVQNCLLARIIFDTRGGVRWHGDALAGVAFDWN